MTVIVLKLVTGEEVLGENIRPSPDGQFRLRNPVGISIVRGSDGMPNVGFSPFPLHAEQKKDSYIDISVNNVVYYYTPAEDFVNNYNQVFGSGIVVPPKKIITG